MIKKNQSFIRIIFLVCCVGRVYACTAFEIFIKYGKSDCAKCITSYPTIIEDFGQYSITIFDQVKEVNELKKNLTYLDSLVNFSNEQAMVKRFASIPSNTLIFYDRENDWVITTISTIAYFDRRIELKRILCDAFWSKTMYIDTVVKTDLFFAGKNGVYLLTAQEINYFSQSNNLTSTYTYNFDTTFFKDIQRRVNWVDFDYQEGFKIYNAINPKLKAMVPSPISIIGNAKSGDEFHVALHVNQYLIQKNNSLLVPSHHCLFLVFNDSGLKDVKVYKYDTKHEPDFTSFKMIDSFYLATFTKGKRNRIWSKNLVVIGPKPNGIHHKIIRKERDPTYVKLYRKIKDHKQYFENAYISENAIVYYMAGYFRSLERGKAYHAYKYGNNVSILNSSNPNNDDFWNELTLFSDYMSKQGDHLVLLSNKEGHQLHVISHSGSVAKYYLGSRNLILSPNIILNDGKIEVNLFNVYTGHWIQNIFTFSSDAVH